MDSIPKLIYRSNPKIHAQAELYSDHAAQDPSETQAMSAQVRKPTAEFSCVPIFDASAPRVVLRTALAHNALSQKIFQKHCTPQRQAVRLRYQTQTRPRHLPHHHRQRQRLPLWINPRHHCDVLQNQHDLQTLHHLRRQPESTADYPSPP